MIRFNFDRTELLDNGLRFSPEYGVLLAPPSRLKIDPSNPRREITEEDIQAKRAGIDGWRKEGHGLFKIGIMEPLKCRSEAGAVLADGSIRKNAKLLIWDGGLKFRATKDDYEWLPVTLDDLNAAQARSAALRTSINNKGHSPIEQAHHAFAAEIKENGESLRALARKYKVDKSYIENRLNLLKAPARRVPDAQTQSRQSQANNSGSAPMSRGKRLTTVSKHEATQEAAQAARSVVANLQTIEQWIEAGGTPPLAALMVARRRIDGLLNL